MIKRKIKKLSTWGKAWLWIVGICTSTLLVLYGSLQIWLFTWKTYKNDEFGFSFRYPSNWFITESVAVSKDQFNKYGWVGLYVDSVKYLPNRPRVGPVRSPGDTLITIQTNSVTTTMDVRNQQGYFSKYVKAKFGNEIGYTFDSVNQTPKNSGSLLVLSKELFVKTDDYTLSANTLTYSENKGVFSRIKAKFFNWIGSQIINSFFFSEK